MDARIKATACRFEQRSSEFAYKPKHRSAALLLSPWENAAAERDTIPEQTPAAPPFATARNQIDICVNSVPGDEVIIRTTDELLSSSIRYMAAGLTVVNPDGTVVPASPEQYFHDSMVSFPPMVVLKSGETKLRLENPGYDVGKYYLKWNVDKETGRFRGPFLRLVTDDKDDAAPEHGTTPDPDNQTVKILALGETVRMKYSPAAGITCTRELQVCRPTSEDNNSSDQLKHDIRTLKVNIVVLRTRKGLVLIPMPQAPASERRTPQECGRPQRVCRDVQEAPRMTTRHNNVLRLRLVLAALSLGTACAIAQDNQPHNIARADVTDLLACTSQSLLHQKISQYTNAPAYQKLWMADQLQRKFGSPDSCHLQGYTRAKGEHDLGRVAGRAAYSVERLLGVELPLMTSEGGGMESETVAQTVRSALEVHRQSENKPREVAELERLTRKYAGTIHLGIYDGAHKAAERMLDLFHEWFPLGKDIHDLDQILGVAGTQTSDGRVYTFDDGNVRVEIRTELITNSIQWVLLDVR